MESEEDHATEELGRIERAACPGAGSCGGMFTANTMSSVIEAMGLSLPHSSTMAAVDAEKADSAAESARVLARAVASNLTPRKLMTRKAFENAIAVVMAIGGSTNAVLHLLAIAHSAEVPLTLDDFETIRARVPVLCDLSPSGRYATTDLHRAGGIPQVMKILLAHGLLHGDALTISGETIAQSLEGIPAEPPPGQDVIRPWSRPVHAQGHLAILRGNLAEEGAVAKISGLKTIKLTGPARVFESEEDSLAAIMGGKILAGDVIVIRHEGPRGGPGMREMLAPTSALMGAGLGDSVALITDGRFSGGYPWSGGGPCGAGSGHRRPDWPRSRRRQHHRGRGIAPAFAECARGRASKAARDLDRAGPPVHPRGAREVRPGRVVGESRSGDRRGLSAGAE